MKSKIIVLTAIIFMLLPLAPNDAHAQSYGQTYEQIRELNVGNPTNSRRFDRFDQIMKRKIQDRKNKVVGTLEDVVVNSRGYIESLEVKFDRLQKTHSVNLNYADAGINASSGGYQLSLYSDDEIEELYPSLLANIQTAAGIDDIYSVKKIIGANLKNENGKIIGKVEDVLFDNQGNFVEALYVKTGQRTRRGKGVAIPFSIAKFDFSGRYRDIIITEEQAGAINDFAETQ